MINILALIFFAIGFHFSATGVLAISNFPKKFSLNHSLSTPFFPSCPNPGGTQVASYDTGLHWIVGNPVLQFGSDKVYNTGNNNFVQCFCPLTEEGSPTGGQGIQTNWLRVGSMSDAEKNALIAKGWILVPNGADFGLLPEPYLARNLNFACSNNCDTRITTSLTGVQTTIRITSSASGSLLR